jgi:hypothetical protein
MDLVIAPDGTARAVYDEAIDLATLGRTAIARASHVEPGPDNRWTADLTPVGGRVLGPFDHRSEAISAEVAWLQEHWLGDQAAGPDS